MIKITTLNLVSNSRSSFSTPVTENLFLKSNYREKIFKSILDSELREDLEYKYSDLPFYFLKFWFEDIYDKPLDDLAYERVFKNFLFPYKLWDIIRLTVFCQ